VIGLDFGFGALEADFWRWMFLMTRIGAALVAAPLFGTTNVPPQVRVILSAVIALLVTNYTHVAAPANLMSIAGFLAIIGKSPSAPCWALSCNSPLPHPRSPPS
jgi:flagellar biosynthetic protein FliR